MTTYTNLGTGLGEAWGYLNVTLPIRNQNQKLEINHNHLADHFNPVIDLDPIKTEILETVPGKCYETSPTPVPAKSNSSSTPVASSSKNRLKPEREVPEVRIRRWRHVSPEDRVEVLRAPEHNSKGLEVQSWRS
ncbi:hypothetical protein B0H14DRAFT_2656803 [Mycena olivaceomarginata]|nr:hypothetical protein B0H14DRAFT_2656803 [Mycena olivaceomarginata]